MKILISGATGFIGSHLIKHLSSKGHVLTALVRPTSNTSLLNKAGVSTIIFDGNIVSLIETLKYREFDGVIHLASLYLTTHHPDQVAELIDSNVTFSASLLEATVESGIPWFINTGTFWQHYKNKKYSPVNLYASTKQAFQDIAAYYVESKKFNFVTLQLSDTYGPEDTRPKIFNLWTRAIKNNEILDMSPGNQLIDITHVDDVVRAFAQLTLLLEKDTSKSLRGKVFAVTSGKPLSLRDLSKIFEKAVGAKLSINWGKRSYRAREVMIPWSKGVSVPGWKPTTNYHRGITEMFNSYKHDKR